MRIRKQNSIRLFLAVAIPILALSSCIKEREVEGGAAGGGESVVRFSVWLPGAAQATRSLSDDNESHVQTIDILMFAQGGGAWRYRAGVSGAAITTDGTDAGKKSFTITMRHGDYDLVMLANARERIVALDLAGKTKSQVLALLAEDAPVGGKWVADDAAAGYRPIPMWGEIGDLTIDGSTEITDADGISLSRMVARVDVRIAPAVDNFTIASVDVYNYNTKGSLAPLPAAWNAAANPPRATAPNVPAGSTLTKGPLVYDNGGGRSEINVSGNKCEREIYIFESENHTGAGHAAAKDRLDRTCLVVGGVYDANANGDFTDDGLPTYYRVDFSTGTGDAETFLDVLRNHNYTFTVTNVTQRGYGTSEEAFQGAKPIDFTVEVTPWGENLKIPLENESEPPSGVTPTLTTDYDEGKSIATDGKTYTINITSNTEWEASVRRGTDAVTAGDASAIGKPLLTATGFGSSASNSYITGNGNGTIDLTTVNYTGIGQLAWGKLEIIFRDKATGMELDRITVTVKDPRLLDSGRYVAKADALSNGTTGNSTMIWAIAMGISTSYNNTVFGQGELYTPTTTTGCGGYWEDNIDDPKSGQGKWRLPTLTELQEMHLREGEIGGFMGGSYWSAKESTYFSARVEYFGSGVTQADNKSVSFSARCVRDID